MPWTSNTATLPSVLTHHTNKIERVMKKYLPLLAAVLLGLAVMKLDERWQLSANASYTERAPTSYELYANGVHAATGTFERGDTQQALEKGRNLDLGLAWRRGANEVKLGQQTLEGEHRLRQHRPRPLRRHRQHQDLADAPAVDLLTQ